MKRSLYLILLSVALAFMSAPTYAQTVTMRTTLTNATTATTGTETITVGTTTNCTAKWAGGFGTTSTTQGFVLIDGELMQINSVPSSTTLTVVHGSTPSAHAAGAEVRCGPGGFNWTPSTTNTAGVFLGSNSATPAGACTRANNQYLPIFQSVRGVVTAYDCPNNVSASTGTWIQWQYYPPTNSVAARTPLPNTVTTYTALASDYLIAVPSVITNNVTITVTLPCSSVPAGKIWIVGDEGGKVGTNGAGISIIGTQDTQQILAGFTSKAYRSNGTNCFRLY